MGEKQKWRELTGEQPRSDDQGLGLSCPRCGCRHFRVITTRPGFGGRILRRRECRHCGKRLTTVEEVRQGDLPAGQAGLEGPES